VGDLNLPRSAAALGGKFDQLKVVPVRLDVLRELSAGSTARPKPGRVGSPWLKDERIKKAFP
jgi:hypothetical protein